jgi:hypothetical protein
MSGPDDDVLASLATLATVSDDMGATLQSGDGQYPSVWKTLAMGQGGQAPRPGSTISPSHLRHSQELRALVRDLPTLVTAREDAQQASGDLRVLQTLGQGGMGVVFLARQRSVGRDVAVKAIREDRRVDSARQGLLHEGWIAGRLEHPNIVPIHAIGLDEDGYPMLVMKRIEGITWSEALADPSRLPETFSRETPLRSQLGILRQLCQAVHFAHSRHVLHRDLKPDNVMLGAFGEVYLVDWGVAVSLADDGTGQLPQLSAARQVAGTPSYMAPELASGDPAAQGPHTDVYLLGAILHEILTGQLRHDGRSLYDVMIKAYVSAPFEYGPEVPADLAALANASCSKDPALRPASAEAFRQALLAYERHAASLNLTIEAEHKLDALRAAGTGAADGAVAQVYAQIGAARFGFEQALREWEDNTRAHYGLNALRVWMVTFEIAQERPDAAASLLAELEPQHHGALDAEISILRERLRLRDVELSRLKRLGHEVDVDVSSRARGQVLAWLALIWFTLPMGVRALDRSGVWPLDYPIFSLLQIVMDATMLVVLYLYRAPLTRNQANLRITSLLLSSFVMSFVTRHLCWLTGASINQATVAELLIYATACFNLAATIDRRVWPSGLFYIAFAAVVGLNPQYTLELLAAGNASAMLAMRVAARRAS